MKYHYKSPTELQTEQQTERKSRPTRNRVTMIVLMDIAILVIIFGVIYFSGVWPTGEKHSGDTVERGDLSFSVTARRESAGAIDFFLNVHNTAGSLREFPAPDDPLQAAHIEVQMNGLTYSTALNVYKEPIRPGETVIYRGEIVLPGQDRSAEYSGAIRLRYTDDETLIRLPE